MVSPALLRSVASKIARVNTRLRAQETPHVRRPALPHVSRSPSRLFSSSPITTTGSTPSPTNQKDLVDEVIEGLDSAAGTMFFFWIFGSWAIPKVKELREKIVSGADRERSRDLVPDSCNVQELETT
ncbi:hypothetical protein EJB05_49200, partial [Eragrostis curvula]